MKSSTALLALISLGSAAVLQPRKVSYDGFKVIRIPVGTDASKMTEIVSRLGLKTWTGAPRAGAFADIVVPPAQIAAFEKETEGMEAATMHEDLGVSIAKESDFDIYAGKLYRSGDKP